MFGDWGFRVVSFSFLLFFCVVGAAQGQEAWYLISEGELRSIEAYRERSEAERLSWLSQASELKGLAGRLRLESESLNAQLRAARGAQRRSEQSFERSENEKLTLLSSKNGEIKELSLALAGEKTQTERYKGLAFSRLLMVIALSGAWALLGAYKVYRLFRSKF
jgi:hypothetical protein